MLVSKNFRAKLFFTHYKLALLLFFNSLLSSRIMYEILFVALSAWPSQSLKLSLISIKGFRQEIDS